MAKKSRNDYYPDYSVFSEENGDVLKKAVKGLSKVLGTATEHRILILSVRSRNTPHSLHSFSSLLFLYCNFTILFVSCHRQHLLLSQEL